MVSTIDLAASMAALASIDLPDDGILDSFNVLDALLGKRGAKGREYIVSQDNGRRGSYGLRLGNWKLQRHDARIMYNGDLSMNTWTVPQFALFNLEEDIEEATDVSDQNQEVFDQLKNQLQSINDGKLSPDSVREIANRLNVKEAEVTDMENRLFSGAFFRKKP